jgi:hypothetical protein
LRYHGSSPWKASDRTKKAADRSNSGLAAFQPERADGLSTMGPFNLQIKTPFINIDKYCNLSNSFLSVIILEPDGLTDRHPATESRP